MDIKNFFKKIFVSYRNTKEIEYIEAKELMKKDNVVLIDVRSKQEYLEGHLLGAINISTYEIFNLAEKLIKNKETILILYCLNGTRSKKAVKMFLKLGYNNIYFLKENYYDLKKT